MTKSKYKIWGGFGLLSVFAIMVMLISLYLLSLPKIDWSLLISDNWNQFHGIFIGIMTFNFIFIRLFIVNCKKIEIDERSITFINPILPHIRKKFYWEDFTYSMLVDEESKHATYEAVWLMENGKIKGRFSSFYYSNYEAMKANVKTRSKGKQEIGKFEQSLALLGFKRIHLN